MTFVFKVMSIAGAFGACVLALATPSQCLADEPPDDVVELDWSYLIDGGAIPFVYGSLALSIGAELVEPPSEPLLFSADEGGAASEVDKQIPPWTVGVGAATMVFTVALVPHDARWFHAKGMVESLLTTTALTGVTKNIFGRHRPDYVAGDPDDWDARRSFFSGHTSATFAATTYFGLYLHTHLIEEYADPDARPWWRVASWTILGAGSAVIPIERVVRHRHHPTDVIVGGVVGTATSAAFFAWQHSRYLDTVGREDIASWTPLMGLDPVRRSLALTWGF